MSPVDAASVLLGRPKKVPKNRGRPVAKQQTQPRTRNQAMFITKPLTCEHEEQPQHTSFCPFFIRADVECCCVCSGGSRGAKEPPFLSNSLIEMYVL